MTFDRLVPYNPQLLLAHTPSNYNHLWDGFDPAWLQGEYGIGRYFFDTTLETENIDFEPRFRDETVLIVSPTGRVVDELHRKVALNHTLAPFVVPRGRMSFNHIEPRQSGKTDKMTATARWREADVSPLDGIQDMLDRLQGVERVKVGQGDDFTEIQKRILAAMLLDGEVLIDIDAPGGLFNQLCDVLGIDMTSFERPIKAEAPSKHKEYLKHDPTKRHNRRTRR